MSITERIEIAVEAALAADPDDWAAASEAAEEASGGRYVEALSLIDYWCAEGRTVSAGLLDGQPVRFVWHADGQVRVEPIPYPDGEPGQFEVRFTDPDTGDCDAETFADLADAELAAAIRRAQGSDPVEVRDLADLVPADAWDRDASTTRRG